MKYQECMIVWNNPAEHRRHYPELANPKIIPFGFDDKRYTFSGGAAFTARRKLDSVTVLALPLYDYFELTMFFGLDPKAVHKALCGIEEFRKAMPYNDLWSDGAKHLMDGLKSAADLPLSANQQRIKVTSKVSSSRSKPVKHSPSSGRKITQSAWARTADDNEDLIG